MNINQIYKQIENLKDLSPSKEVNEAFSSLVSKSIQYNLDGKLTRYEIAKLQELSSKAEFELEKYWAQRISFAKDPKKEISEFPYLKNYSDLTKLELYTLKSCLNHPNHKVVFIGGGPLPMTAIMLALEHNISSAVVDIDGAATKMATDVVKALGLNKKITVLNADGADFDYKNFNIIFVAALAGLNSKTKKAIFNQIKKTAPESAHLIARSSWRNRKLLYKPISPTIYKVFQPIVKVDPFNDIVNSIVILKVHD